ncbi:MAG: hypothetical protein [Microvirus sp.]|nr:MAG: hypothetical protein [Microvirus sp.]
MKRYKMSKKSSGKNFTKHASRTHKFNLASTNPMRGGYRL